MNFEKAHDIICERSLRYLDDVRQNEIDKQGGSLILFGIFLISGLAIGWMLAELGQMIDLTFEGWITETLARAIMYPIAILLAIAATGLIYIPMVSSVRKRLELIDRIKDDVLYRAINEAYDESK